MTPEDEGDDASRDPQMPSEREFARTQRDVNEQLVLSTLRAQEQMDAAETAAKDAKASQDTLRTLADMIPILAWYADPDGAIRWYNRRWSEYTGTALDAREDWKWLSVLDPDDLPRVAANWKAAMTSGEPWEDEFLVRRSDGQFRWFLSRAMPMRDSQGHIVRWFGTSVDVHDKKRAAEERALWLASERVAREDAEASNRIKDEFLATMSHELRTPLNAILGWSSQLRRGICDDKSIERAIATIERNARAQARLIEDLLDVSRIISGKLKLELGRVDMNEIARAAVDVVRPAADAKGLRLIVESAPENVAKLVGDADRLQQVMWNLLSNAVKFTPSKGTVSVRVERFESTARFIVRDTGLGIPREHLPFIFERFRQVDSSTTRRFGGLGLGLAIVRHLVEMHGGAVAVESSGLGLGSTFTVRLPIRALFEAEAEVEEEPKARISSRAPASSAGLSAVKILIVDDDEDSRLLLESVLQSVGASVHMVDSARAAFAFIEKHPVDVMISDIGMPEEDGLSLIRRIRALPASRGGQVPALALTAYARSEDALRARQAGYQSHLAKPVEGDKLTRTVAKLVSRLAPVP
jgi:PAS domain S-box-containing protein